MIPVSLTIKGLYSYQNETTIDFEPLTNAGLFGIFGAVGSGKSSILEAITFALYGETERLNSKESRGYNMMNLKSNELFIDYIFYTGLPKVKYRFTVRSKRNKKKFTETTAFERNAYQQVNEQWQPITKTADEILGLSYKNFKRTIIIPQGKFQEFMQLKDTERVQMLKEIFNLEKFELGPAVATLVKENDLKISNVEGQLLSLPIIDEEAVRLSEQEILHAETKLKEESRDLQRLQEEEKALENLKNLFLNVQNKSERFTALKANEADYKRLGNEINEFENCERVFNHLLTNKTKLEHSIQLIEKSLCNEKASLEIVQQQVQKLQAEQLKLQEDFSKKDALLQKVTEWEKLIVIKKIDTNIVECNRRITKGQKLIDDIDKELKNLKAIQQQLQQTIQQEEADLPDTNNLILLNNWFLSYEKLKADQTQLVAELTLTESNRNKQIQHIKDHLNKLNGHIEFSNFPETYEIVKTKIEEAISNNSLNTVALKDEMSHLKLSEKLGYLIQQIEQGKECPLCGSLHHPHILSVEKVSEKIDGVQNEIIQLENQNSRLQKSLQELAFHYAEYSNITSAEATLKNKKQQVETYILELESSFNFEGYDITDRQKVKDQLQLVDEKNKSISNLRNQLANNYSTIEEQTATLAQYNKVIENINLETARLSGEKNLLISQIVVLNYEDEILRPEKEVLQEIESTKKNYTGIVQNVERAIKQLQEHQSTQNLLQGKIEEINKQLQRQKEELENSAKTLRNTLEQNGYKAEEEVRQIISKNLNVLVEKEKLLRYQQELYTATIQLDEAQKLIENKNYDNIIHQNIINQVNEKKDITLHMHEQLIKLKKDVEIQKQNLIQRTKLQTDLDKLTERAANLKIMNNLFRLAGFVNYVSSVYLQNLVNSANKRFYKMTAQKLSLELTEDNSFQIRDFFNNGECRNIKTLSGGQTFQAALSLALALADNIQHLSHTSENFFFLDEGFGSLDKEALTIAFETLKNLKKENRIVGLISHVEEMKQEIEMSLTIKNDPESGSYISKSWLI